MVHLALFDIDGTLIRSTGLDDRCYARAVTDVFGIAGFSTDWMDYRHSTDSGIITELVQNRLGRDPTGGEMERFQEHFLGLLKAAFDRDPGELAAVPGAAELIQALESSGRWRAGIATGTWRRCARWKLTLAGLDPDALPLATADDALDRAEIVLTAIHRAVGMPTPAAPAKACPPSRGVPPEGIVYVGDGPWDWRTARRLGIGFVGVAAGGDSRRLSQAGVEPVVEDFLAPDRVLRLLEAAARAPTPALLAAVAGP